MKNNFKICTSVPLMLLAAHIGGLKSPYKSQMPYETVTNNIGRSVSSKPPIVIQNPNKTLGVKDWCEVLKNLGQPAQYTQASFFNAKLFVNPYDYGLTRRGFRVTLTPESSQTSNGIPIQASESLFPLTDKIYTTSLPSCSDFSKLFQSKK